MAFSSFNEFLFMAPIDSWFMVRSPERIFKFWKQEEVTGRQIWRIRWLSNDFCFVFSQKFSHNQAGMWRRITVVWRRRRFSSTIFFTFSMLSSSTEVDGRLAWGKFSMTSRPSLNALCHSNTCVPDRVDSPKHFWKIFNDSVAAVPLETQNFKQIRCSIFFP